MDERYLLISYIKMCKIIVTYFNWWFYMETTIWLDKRIGHLKRFVKNDSFGFGWKYRKFPNLRRI